MNEEATQPMATSLGNEEVTLNAHSPSQRRTVIAQVKAPASLNDTLPDVRMDKTGLHNGEVVEELATCKPEDHEFAKEVSERLNDSDPWKVAVGVGMWGQFKGELSAHAPEKVWFEKLPEFTKTWLVRQTHLEISDLARDLGKVRSEEDRESMKIGPRRKALESIAWLAERVKEVVYIRDELDRLDLGAPEALSKFVKGEETLLSHDELEDLTDAVTLLDTLKDRRADLPSHIPNFRDRTLVELTLKNQDLSRADFTGAGLVDMQFVNCNLSDAKFDKTLMKNVTFRDCDLGDARLKVDAEQVRFERCDLSKTVVKGRGHEVVFDDCAMKRTTLRGQFTSSSIKDCTLNQGAIKGNWVNSSIEASVLDDVDMRHLILHSVKFESVDLNGNLKDQPMEMGSSTWVDVTLKNVQAHNVNINHSRMLDCDIVCCDLSGADIQHSEIDASFDTVDLRVADLTGTKIRGQLCNVDLALSNMEGCTFTPETVMNVDMRGAHQPILDASTKEAMLANNKQMNTFRMAATQSVEQRWWNTQMERQGREAPAIELSMYDLTKGLSGTVAKRVQLASTTEVTASLVIAVVRTSHGAALVPDQNRNLQKGDHVDIEAVRAPSKKKSPRLRLSTTQKGNLKKQGMAR